MGDLIRQQELTGRQEEMETVISRTESGFYYDRDGNCHGPFASHIEASEHCFQTYTAKIPGIWHLYPEVPRDGHPPVH